MFALNASAQAPAPKQEPYPGEIAEVYVQHIPKPLPVSNYCSCVNYAKAYLGKSGETWGNAWKIQVTTQIPSLNSLVLTTEGPGHVAVVISMDAETITVTEANYVRCKKTMRVIRRDSPLIKGYRVVL